MVCAWLMHKKNTSKDCDNRDNNNNNNNNNNNKNLYSADINIAIFISAYRNKNISKKITKRLHKHA